MDPQHQLESLFVAAFATSKGEATKRYGPPQGITLLGGIDSEARASLRTPQLTRAAETSPPQRHAVDPHKGA